MTELEDRLQAIVVDFDLDGDPASAQNKAVYTIQKGEKSKMKRVGRVTEPLHYAISISDSFTYRQICRGLRPL